MRGLREWWLDITQCRHNHLVFDAGWYDITLRCLRNRWHPGKHLAADGHRW